MDHRFGLCVDPARKEPLYRQIFDGVVDRVRTGALPVGARLPATRALARELGTHRNTVVRAYEDLEAAGFVRSTVGRGTFVSPPATSARQPPARRELAGLPWGSLVASLAGNEALGRFDRLRRVPERPDGVTMTRMQPSQDLLPSELLRRCVDHVLRTLGARALGYGAREGIPRLRGLIAEDLARQGIAARAEDILVTTGAQQALDLAARALVNPGDPVLVSSLTYPGALGVFAAAGARLVGVPHDDDGPSPAALRRLSRAGAKALYVMPTCHNPTGSGVTSTRRHELIAWSHEAGVPIIEDDFGADLDLDGQPFPPALRALDGSVLYIGSFSKRLIPALRVGFLLAPPPLRALLVSLKHATDLGTSLLLQHVLAEFLERGYLRAHLGRVLPEYRRRLAALEAGLAAHLPPGLGHRRPDKGVLLWLPLPPEIDADAAALEASRRGVHVTPSTLFAVDGREPPGLRMTFCSEPPERLVEGTRRLGRALAALASQARSAARRPPRAGDTPPTVEIV